MELSNEYNAVEEENISLSDNSELEKELQKFNWGVFQFNWIWGLCNGSFIKVAKVDLIVFGISLILSIFAVILLLSQSSSDVVKMIYMFIFIIIMVAVNIVAYVYLGKNGNRWAWEGKEWKDLNHFRDVQKTWAIAAIILITIGCLNLLMQIGAISAKAVSMLSKPADKDLAQIVKIVTMPEIRGTLRSTEIADFAIRKINETSPGSVSLYNDNTILYKSIGQLGETKTTLYSFIRTGKNTCQISKKNCAIVSYNKVGKTITPISKIYYDRSGKIKEIKIVNNE